ncbi:LysR family transcriptional regulator [Pseudomonas sp. B2M1-30]|uniref:LysR family transcriptional regulator n=1 Tax=Pseudomonas TaxID=286 RepID=UPI0021C8EBF8|nr:MULTISPECIES: LysR family transcriptional regulator [Pseudomonas]MCU0118899.1 LysR family transcriptional regulator [Pseudomonas sp. B2M1-30]MCU7263381.1 LysR family transcriptional regulator [Pseudomonas koreensis]
MDIRHLKAFLAVFEERNITAAAQRLFISQPTLSVTIKQLEEELGATLFVRQPRGVEVSAEARLLYPQARRMVAESEALSRMFRSREDRVPLTLGIEGDIAARHIEAFVRMARQALPNLLLTLEEGCHGDGRLAVEDMCCEDELFLPLWEESYVMALPVDHPMAMAGAGWTPIEDWITCPQHPSHQRLMALYGRSPAAVAGHAGSLQQALHMVAAGVGVAMLPQSLVHGQTRVVERAWHLPAPTRRVGLCCAAQALELPALRGLHEFFQVNRPAAIEAA